MDFLPAVPGLCDFGVARAEIVGTGVTCRPGWVKIFLMKIITTLLAVLSLFVFASCAKDQPASDAAAPKTEESASKAAESASADKDKAAAPSDKAADMGAALEGAKGAAAAAIPADAAAQVKEAAGFSDTVSKTWETMKGMDFSKHAEFIKMATDLVSKAKGHLDTLNKLSSALPEGMSGKLLSQVGGLSDKLGGLSGLLGGASSLSPGDWAGFKDKVGGSLGGLSSGFSALGGLL